MAGLQPDDFAAELVDNYVGGMSIPQVSNLLSIPQSTVRYHLKKHNVLRTRTDGVRRALKGKSSPLKGRARPQFSTEWKENISKGKIAHGDKHAKGVSIKPNGYLEYTRGPHKFRLVHVVKMEARLGRALLEDECVHHIDSDKLNNEDNNLALVTRSGHSRLHRHEDKLCGKSRERDCNGRFC